VRRERTLILRANQHAQLQRHLFPGDGKEAAAVVLCMRQRVGEQLKFLARAVLLVPHGECERFRDRLQWPGDYLDKALEAAKAGDLSIFLVHSHPSGYPDFSELDDESDAEVMPSLFLARVDAAVDGWRWHGSAIMLPTGELRARAYDEDYTARAVDLVAVYGDDLQFYWHDRLNPGAQRPMAFTSAMTEELGRLHVVIVGVSGTGSIAAEQLLRMGFGEITVIDFDHVEDKNLNRILNSTAADAKYKRLKVVSFKNAAHAIRPGTQVHAVDLSIDAPRAVELAAAGDILFSCVDTETGRHMCDRLAAAMLQPLFDVGVSLPVEPSRRGKVLSNVAVRTDYVQPGGATLFDRQVYTSKGLAAEDLRARDPAAFEEQVAEGYMPGSGEHAPSVICVNMLGASRLALDFIARAYPFRVGGNRAFAHYQDDQVGEDIDRRGEDEFVARPFDVLACGLSAPLLGLPELEDRRCGL